ncbi:MAG TPA: macro domain-containing protein [Kofleriaceae bacterium]|jgi:O-acetyl-ADP-ribose deacetylase (regulator of RNase III)
MIEDATGDLFAANVDGLANPVNTVGVMGKGLARAFAKRFPDNLAAYRRACAAGEVRIGEVLVVDRVRASPRWILNVPTKRHWRSRSRLDDVRLGLVDLVRQVRAHAIGSLAIPALGCGLGGLDWRDVRPLVVDACAPLETVRILLFPPG